jgi:NH3-dependent NAD+ synthetase
LAAAVVGCSDGVDSASVTAVWLTSIGWVFRVLAWVFAALFIAGFTSAVRKT